MDLFHFLNLGHVKQFSLNGVHIRRFWIFAGHLRTWIEAGAALFLLLWTIHQLPFAVKILEELFRRLAAVVTTPLFAFLFGNAIVAALYAKSRCGEDSTLQIAKVAKAANDAPTESQQVAEEANVECNDKQLIPVSSEAEQEQSDEKEEEIEEQEQCPQDSLSDAEFQRAVDEFIAKHLKLRHDESLSIVVNPNAPLIEPIFG